MPQPDTQLVRFRIDPQLRDQAAAVCTSHGMELPDLLRLVVTRIARDGAIPAGLLDQAGRRTEQAPFLEYDARLWTRLQPQLSAEVALALLSRFIADCSTWLDEAKQQSKPDRPKVKLLEAERAGALRLRQSLDVTNAEQVSEVLQTYGPKVRDMQERA